MKKKPACERSNYLAQLALAAPDPTLAALYSQTLATVAAKSVIRLNSKTKRHFCKKCRRVLEAWRIEDKSKAGNHPMLKSNCICGATKRRPLAHSKRPTSPPLQQKPSLNLR